jgi:hypothetical protein
MGILGTSSSKNSCAMQVDHFSSWKIEKANRWTNLLTVETSEGSITIFLKKNWKPDRKKGLTSTGGGGGRS